LARSKEWTVKIGVGYIWLKGGVKDLRAIYQIIKRDLMEYSENIRKRMFGYILGNE
jgi:hypothetical protein